MPYREGSTVEILLILPKEMVVTGLAIWSIFMLGPHTADISMELALQEMTPVRRTTGEVHGGTAACLYSLVLSKKTVHMDHMVKRAHITLNFQGL